MSKYVDKIKKSDETYEIHDSRLEVTSEDVGKVVTVNEEGELALINAPASGTKLYKHVLSSSTINLSYEKYEVLYNLAGEPTGSYETPDSIQVLNKKTTPTTGTGFEIVFISTDNTEITTKALLNSYSKYIIAVLSLKNQGGYTSFYNLEIYNSSNLKFSYTEYIMGYHSFSIRNTISYFSGSATFTDTVTEL